MSTLTLYSSALCPYAQRVRLMLAAKQLAAAEIEIDPRRKPADVLALSPTGKIPLLVHDGARIWDSAVINEYLDETFPQPALRPATPAQRALARLWIEFADTRLYEPTHQLLVCFDPDAQAKLAGELAAALRCLETHALAVHDGPWWLGADFSLADIALYPWFEQVAVLARFRGFRMPEDCPRLSAWRAAVARHPGIAPATRPPEFYLEGYAALYAQYRQAS